MPILTIRHVTTYHYRQPVAFGDHRMMLRPRDDNDQKVLRSGVAISPEPRRIDWTRDDFGNHVATASFSGRATELRFDSTICVDHAPARFDPADIAEYARSMVMYAERMSDEWQDGQVRDIDQDMMHLTLQIVAKTLFSADVSSDADEIGAAMTSMVKLFNYLLLPFSEWLEKLPLPQSKRFARAKDKLNDVIYGIIDERRRSGEDTGDLLSMLLMARDEEGGGRMTDDQIRDECLTLFLAGHETTAVAMTWVWCLLSQNPEKEAKLHCELDAVLPAQHGIPAVDDLPNLQYTEAVIAESMRLFPPAWAIGRLSTEDYKLREYHLPPKSLVLISPYITHRDARFWENANEFIPERWEKLSVKEAGQRNIYLPFGGGIRRCIGESFAWTEAILLLATLARKWKLRLVPEQKIGVHPMITLRPKYGMRMTIRPR